MIAKCKKGGLHAPLAGSGFRTIDQSTILAICNKCGEHFDIQATDDKGDPLPKVLI